MTLFVVVHDKIVCGDVQLEVLLIIFVQFGLKLLQVTIGVHSTLILVPVGIVVSQVPSFRLLVQGRRLPCSIAYDVVSLEDLRACAALSDVALPIALG